MYLHVSSKAVVTVITIDIQNFDGDRKNDI